MRDAVLAMRTSVAVTRRGELRCLWFRGDAAWETLDRLVAADLYVRDGQLRHALLLDGDARPFADCYVGRDDEDYFLLSDGPDAEAIAAHLAAHGAVDGTWSDATGSVGVIGLDGPYAWELLAAVAGAGSIGLPYLTFFHLDDWIVCRAGNTGEYGYLLLVPNAEHEAVLARLLEAGAAFDAVEGGREALDQCALENGFFNIHREGRGDVSPLELQLQWRVSPIKAFVGREALARRRASGPRRRLTTLVSAAPLGVGDDVQMGTASVGRVVNAGASPVREDWIALALVDVAWAHPGVPFTVAGRDGAAAARAVSPPVLDNRSLYVSPQRHSYATRGEDRFPPLPRTSP